MPKKLEDCCPGRHPRAPRLSWGAAPWLSHPAAPPPGMQKGLGCRKICTGYLGHRDSERDGMQKDMHRMPGTQRFREGWDAEGDARDAWDAELHRAPGRAPATMNTCGFGLHTLTPGASSKENFRLRS